MLIGRGTISDKFDKFRVNEEIRAKEVRLVGEKDGQAVISFADAMRMAKEKDLDLVEISPNQDPPVVRIIDFAKFRFEQMKKTKEAKKKQKVFHVKEIKLRPNIDSNDFNHKIKNAMSFLEKGDKVKFTLMFRGREMVHPELGFEVMKQVKETLADRAQVEKEPAQEGRNIIMYMIGKIPQKKK